VRKAVNVFGVHSLKRIVLGGTDDTLALMKRELPQRLQNSVVGTFIAASHASDQEIIVRALALAQVAEALQEEQQVAELSDALANRPGSVWGQGSRRAVQGAGDTLQALSQQRVQLLLLRRGFHLPGSVCDNCGSLFNTAGGPCPYCKNTLRAVLDVLEHAVERAEAEGAEVEFVTESPALEALGGIGAILRF
jgi:peptide subunit release factor 1 (eRF1)